MLIQPRTRSTSSRSISPARMSLVSKSNTAVLLPCCAWRCGRWWRPAPSLYILMTIPKNIDRVGISCSFLLFVSGVLSFQFIPVPHCGHPLPVSCTYFATVPSRCQKPLPRSALHPREATSPDFKAPPFWVCLFPDESETRE